MDEKKGPIGFPKIGELTKKYAEMAAQVKAGGVPALVAVQGHFEPPSVVVPAEIIVDTSIQHSHCELVFNEKFPLHPHLEEYVNVEKDPAKPHEKRIVLHGGAAVVSFLQQTLLQNKGMIKYKSLKFFLDASKKLTEKSESKSYGESPFIAVHDSFVYSDSAKHDGKFFKKIQEYQQQIMGSFKLPKEFLAEAPVSADPSLGVEWQKNPCAEIPLGTSSPEPVKSYFKIPKSWGAWLGYDWGKISDDDRQALTKALINGGVNSYTAQVIAVDLQQGRKLTLRLHDLNDLWDVNLAAVICDHISTAVDEICQKSPQLPKIRYVQNVGGGYRARFGDESATFANPAQAKLWIKAREKELLKIISTWDDQPHPSKWRANVGGSYQTFDSYHQANKWVEEEKKHFLVLVKSRYYYRLEAKVMEKAPLPVLTQQQLKTAIDDIAAALESNLSTPVPPPKPHNVENLEKLKASMGTTTLPDVDPLKKLHGILAACGATNLGVIEEEAAYILYHTLKGVDAPLMLKFGFEEVMRQLVIATGVEVRLKSLNKILFPQQVTVSYFGPERIVSERPYNDLLPMSEEGGKVLTEALALEDEDEKLLLIKGPTGVKEESVELTVSNLTPEEAEALLAHISKNGEKKMVAKKVMKEIGDGNKSPSIFTWEFHSGSMTSGGKPVRYETILRQDGTTSCNCMGWTMGSAKSSEGRHCKHTKSIANEAQAIYKHWKKFRNVDPFIQQENVQLESVTVGNKTAKVMSTSGAKRVIEL